MKNIKLIVYASICATIVASCGKPHHCRQSYSPNELDWHGYNRVAAFNDYFQDYEPTIREHLGDTVRVYGRTAYNRYGMQPPRSNSDVSLTVLSTFFDHALDERFMYILNPSNIDIPESFYYKTLYVTGTVIHATNENYLLCGPPGTGIELIYVDTIPNNI